MERPIPVVCASPVRRIIAEYGQRGLDFNLYLTLHLRDGFVFSTPTMFVMGRPVRKGADRSLIRNPEFTFKTEVQDAWWIHGFAGDMSKLAALMPWRLEWVGFERWDEFPRFYALDRLVEKAMQGAK